MKTFSIILACAPFFPIAAAQANDPPAIHEKSVDYCTKQKELFNRKTFIHIEELSNFSMKDYAAYLHNLGKKNWRNCLRNYIASHKPIDEVDSDFLESWVDEDLEKNLDDNFKQVSPTDLQKMKEIFYTEMPFPTASVYDYLNRYKNGSCIPE